MNRRVISIVMGASLALAVGAGTAPAPAIRQGRDNRASRARRSRPRRRVS